MGELSRAAVRTLTVYFEVLEASGRLSSRASRPDGGRGERELRLAGVRKRGERSGRVWRASGPSSPVSSPPAAGPWDFGNLTSARLRNTLPFVMGTVAFASGTGDLRPSAKRKFLSKSISKNNQKVILMDDNLENMLNEVPWLRAEPMSIDNAKIEPQATDSKKTRFFQRTGNKVRTGIFAAGLTLLGLLGGAACSAGGDDNNHTIKYEHKVSAKALKTLHYGLPITDGTFRVIMESTGVTYPPLSQDAAILGTPTREGTVLDLPETTTRAEKCTIIMYPEVISEKDCVAREIRNVPVTNTTLVAKDVIYKPNVDLAYLTTSVLTVKNNSGLPINSSWGPKFINGSSNPDGTTGLYLDPMFIDGVLYQGVLYGVKPAIADFIEWSKKYFNTENVEAYITNYSFNDQGTYVYDGIQPPDGEFRLFRKTDTSGVTNITYPRTEVNTLSSVERVNQESASAVAAYYEALNALVGGPQANFIIDKFKNCVPILAWRSRGDSGFDWYIDIINDKESEKYGGDNVTTENYSQKFEYLPANSTSVTGPSGFSVNYTPGDLPPSIVPALE